MVLLELFGVDDTEIAADSDAFGPADIGTLEFLVLFSPRPHIFSPMMSPIPTAFI